MCFDYAETLDLCDLCERTNLHFNSSIMTTLDNTREQFLLYSQLHSTNHSSVISRQNYHTALFRSIPARHSLESLYGAIPDLFLSRRCDKIWVTVHKFCHVFHERIVLVYFVSPYRLLVQCLSDQGKDSRLIFL